MAEEIEFRYDTQLLIEGKDLDEDHTNEPWKLLEYCASIGEIYDIVVEDMIRQSKGLHG